MSFRDRFDRFMARVPLTKGECYLLAFLLLLTLAIARWEVVFAPLTVGWPAARTLVEKEAELVRTRHRIREYRAAAEYFGTDEGKEFARRLLYNESRPDERRGHLVPTDRLRKKPAPLRALEWLAQREAKAAEAARRKRDIFLRLFRDPQPPAADTAPVTDVQAKDALREAIARTSAQKPAPPQAPGKPAAAKPAP